MQENQVSITALATAFARAYHAKHATLKIFDDFLAYDFFTEEGRAYLEQSFAESLGFYNPELAASNPDQATALAWLMQNQLGSATLSRSRYTEDSLEAAIEQGVEQYVILGAGMDTFAFRQAKLPKQIQVFEVDHPATQLFKRQRLEELGWELPSQLHFISIDFAKKSLAEKLISSSYNLQALSFFSWLGVTYYLTSDVVFDTLRTIADITPSGSSIVFDYLDSDAFVPERTAKRVKLMQEVVKQVGEPMKTGFEPFSLADNLKNIGLNLNENLSPSDIEESYFQERNDDYHAFEHIHLARVKVL